MDARPKDAIKRMWTLMPLVEAALPLGSGSKSSPSGLRVAMCSSMMRARYMDKFGFGALACASRPDLVEFPALLLRSLL